MAGVYGGEPIAFVAQRALADGEYAPEPNVIIGTLPVGAIAPAATVAQAVVAADGTSAGTQLNLLIVHLQAAGLLA
jgi:hypothetical protein